MDVSLVAQRDWPKTPGQRSAKIMCPVCHASGYIGGRWTNKHAEHERCPDCDTMFPASSLAQHRRMKHPTPKGTVTL